MNYESALEACDRRIEGLKKKKQRLNQQIDSKIESERSKKAQIKLKQQRDREREVKRGKSSEMDEWVQRLDHLRDQ